MSSRPYDQYKDSGRTWLGKVPAHWELKPLWTFYRRTKRTGFEGEELLSVYRDYGVIPKSSRDDNFNKPSDDLSPYQLVEPSDLVINKMKAWQGSVAVSEYRGIVSPAYHVFECLHDQDSRYLHYLMRSLRYITGYLLMSKGIRVNQWDLEPQQHTRMLLLVPPPDEQQAISSFLDVETSKIDGLVSEQRRLIELLKEKRQAVISHAVTKGLNPNAPMKPSGIQWLGDIPQHWSVTRIKFMVQPNDGIQMGPFGGMLLDLDGENTGYKVFGQENTISGDFTRGQRWISQERYEELERYAAKDGDLVLTRKGSLGNARLIEDLPQPGIIDSDTIRIRVDDDAIASRYLAKLLHEVPYIAEQITRQKRGAILPGLNTGIIANLVVVLPIRDEQNELLSYLDAESLRFDMLQAEAERAIELLQERRTALISAAVTGKIDVRNISRGVAENAETMT